MTKPPSLKHPDKLRIGIRPKFSSLPRFVEFYSLRGFTQLPEVGDSFRLPDEEQWYEVEERLLDYREGVIEIRCVEMGK
jgi:hypothetical protein